MKQRKNAATHKQWRIAERVSDAILIVDEERMIIFANEAAARLAGAQSANELIGMSYPTLINSYRIFNNDGSEANLSTIPSEIAFTSGKESHNRMYSLIDMKGTHHWISVTAFAVPDTRGNMAYVAIICRDVTRRKLREDKLRFLIESSKILSINTDNDTRVREKTRLLIPTLADWATINILNKNGELVRLAVEHRNPSKVPLVEKLASLAAKRKHNGIYRVAATRESEFYPILSPQDYAKNGSSEEERRLLEVLKPSSAMIVPIKSGTHILGVLSLAFAESGRRYTQEDLEFMEEFGNHLAITIDNARLYEEIAKRDAAKDAFLATLSHELRNPLAPIKSSLELLRIKNKDTPVLDELSVVEHQFDHIEKLLQDLLDVTRLTLGKLEIDRTSVDLTSLVRMTIATHRRKIEVDGVGLSLYLPSQPLWIHGDSVRIEQAVVNLLSNAGKFTKRGGLITVALHTEGQHAVLTVRDTGIGIGQKDIARIFDRYFQGTRKAPHQQNGGLGMGLVLVQEIVQLHGGTVTAASAGEGQGSTFTVALPLASHVQRSSTKKERSQGGTHRILVIDDNKDAADSLVKLLNAAGYQAVAAYSGSEGTENFTSLRPSHMIIDIAMPGMNGYDVAKYVRSTSDMAQTTLIALSGYGMEEDKRRSEEAGFDCHLTKPVGLYELQTALETKKR